MGFQNGQLVIQDLNCEYTMPISQSDVKIASKNLGMKLEPALVFNDATEFVVEKIHRFNTKMLGSPLCTTDENYAYKSFFTPVVYYRIELISLNKKQAQTIYSAWIALWVNCLGISRKSNKHIRHMLKEDRGLELFKLKDIILIKKCKHLFGHLMLG